MDDELRRWADTWQSIEGDGGLLQRAQSAHRGEATLRAVATIALIVGALAVASSLVVQLSGSVAVPVRWFRLAIAAGALLVGVGAMAHWSRQIAAARADLTDTPLGMLVDLARLHERELSWWLGKGSLATTALLAAVALGLGVAQLQHAVTAGASTTAAWRVLLCVAIALAALAAVGVARVRYLRRALAAVRELQRQLAGPPSAP